MLKPPIYGLTAQTADKLRLMLGDRGDERSPAAPTSRGRTTTLVRCTSATAAGATGAAAQCYPAQIVVDPYDATAPTEVNACWLTVWDGDGTAGVPTAGQVYTAILGARLEVGTDSRIRAFAGGGSGGGGTEGCIVGLYAAPALGNLPDTWQPGPQLRLPDAGTYLVWWSGTAYAQVEGGSSSLWGRVMSRLYSCTDADTIGNERVLLHCYPTDAVSSSTPFARSFMLSQFTEVDSATTLRLEFQANTGGNAVFLTGIDATTVGDGIFGYIRLAWPTGGCDGSGCPSGASSGSGSGPEPIDSGGVTSPPPPCPTPTVTSEGTGSDAGLSPSVAIPVGSLASNEAFVVHVGHTTGVSASVSHSAGGSFLTGGLDSSDGTFRVRAVTTFGPRDSGTITVNGVGNGIIQARVIRVTNTTGYGHTPARGTASGTDTTAETGTSGSTTTAECLLAHAAAFVYGNSGDVSDGSWDNSFTGLGGVSTGGLSLVSAYRHYTASGATVQSTYTDSDIDQWVAGVAGLIIG